MELLIDAGANCFEALKLAIELEDVASVEMLIDRDCPIFHEGDESTDDPSRPNDIVGLVAQQANEEISTIFIRGLKDRRQRLADLALSHLSDEERDQLGMRYGRILDAAALDTYCLLVKNGVAVPKACYPGKIRTVYHFRLGQGKPIDISFYDSLFLAGFRDIDEQTKDFDTPLLQHSTMLSRSDDEFSYLSWFFEKGANPNFRTKDSFPNILFYLGAHCHWMPVLNADELFLFTNLTKRAAGICDPLTTDKCKCYCSSKGCLASNKFATCDAQEIYHDSCVPFRRPELDRLLEWWMQSSGLSDTQKETYYHEACQLEIFDRLGMAHTCCMNQKRPYERKRIVIPEVTRVQLQQGDAELRLQLELIMHMYRECRGKFFVGSKLKFWNWWWDYVNDILPALLPQERCRFRCKSQFRLAEKSSDQTLRIQEEVLRQNGYGDLDFVDVIVQHFNKILDTEHLLEGFSVTDDGTANFWRKRK